jgi:hypothetical protein
MKYISSDLVVPIVYPLAKYDPAMYKKVFCCGMPFPARLLIKNSEILLKTGQRKFKNFEIIESLTSDHR